jgi:DNA-binding LacI/PurR family transcriptional regulator
MVDETVALILDKITNPSQEPKHIKVESPLIIRSSAKIENRRKHYTSSF